MIFSIYVKNLGSKYKKDFKSILSETYYNDSYYTIFIMFNTFCKTYTLYKNN